MTKNAKLILDCINNTTKHFTAEDIYLDLLLSGKKISIATIYNSLNWLCQNNYIKKIFIDDNIDRYDRVEKHDHLICIECGKISDIKFEDLTNILKNQTNEQIIDYDLKVKYICPECKKK